MHKSKVCSATALLDDRVRNSAGEDLGRIEDVVIDPDTGYSQYAIVSFGGVAGTGNKVFAIPWSALNISPSHDYVVLNVAKERLHRAPGFDRGDWPNMGDPVWRRSIDDYYGIAARPVLQEPKVYVDRRVVPARRGLSLFAGIVLVCLVLGLAWMTFLVSTRGWDQAKQDIQGSLQGAAYAAKETSLDAALTTRVKTALSLSKRIPSDKINVDSEGDLVTLRGEVPSDQIRELAESIARDVPGVREVHNHLFAVSRSQ